MIIVNRNIIYLHTIDLEMTLRSLLFTLLAFINLGIVTAQDAQFSQAFAAPLLLNPALAGTFDGSYRLNLNYRDQWRSALETPLTTFSVGGELQFETSDDRVYLDDKVGVGIQFFADRVSGFDLNTNAVYFYGAYHKSLNSKKIQYIGVGAQFGIHSRTVNYENLSFHDQFNSLDGFTLATGESLPPNNLGFLDFGVGLNYTDTPNNALTYTLGVGLLHFGSSNISFFKTSDSNDPSLIKENNFFKKWTSHASMSIQTGKRLRIQPRITGMLQGPHVQVNLGTNFRYSLVRATGKAVHFGGWLRGVSNDSGYSLATAAVTFTLEYNAFIFGLSYDQSIGDIVDSRLGLNAFELSIVFRGNHTNEGTICPIF